MTIVQSQDINTNFATYANLAFSEPIYVSRPQKKNVVIISASRFEELLKAENNRAMDKKLNQARLEIENGQGVAMAFEELDI